MTVNIPLGNNQKIIDNHYNKVNFNAYSEDFRVFKADLFAGKTNSICLDIPLEQNLHVNGEMQLHLTLKSSSNKGILSAQVLDYGQKKRPRDTTAVIDHNAIDNGYNFSREDLRELPFIMSQERVITKGVINLQNRKSLLDIEELPANEWINLDFKLQPSIYRLTKGDKLRILLYTTDFEHTIHDNSTYILTLDLEKSSLEIPHL